MAVVILQTLCDPIAFVFQREVGYGRRQYSSELARLDLTAPDATEESGS